MGGSIRIFEKVDFDLLIKAYNLFLEKNDGLRLRIVEKDGEPLDSGFHLLHPVLRAVGDDVPGRFLFDHRHGLGTAHFGLRRRSHRRGPPDGLEKPRPGARGPRRRAGRHCRGIGHANAVLTFFLYFLYRDVARNVSTIPLTM